LFSGEYTPHGEDDSINRQNFKGDENHAPFGKGSGRTGKMKFSL
jgi:hypothetical protein